MQVKAFFFYTRPHYEEFLFALRAHAEALGARRVTIEADPHELVVRVTGPETFIQLARLVYRATEAAR